MESLKAGRELDREVAEKVMGWKQPNPKSVSAALNLRPWPRPYSNDIGAAWEVVEKIKSKHRHIFHLDFYDGEWTCGFEEINTDLIETECRSHSAPLAICLAALKAVESA